MNFFTRAAAQTDAQIGTASSKLSDLMGKIMHSTYNPKYDVIPPIDTTVAINPFKTKHAFTDSGDTMQNQRRKSIHKRGLVFQARYVPVDNIHGYTGIFEKGCEHGIGRFSYATPPTVSDGVTSVLYGFAMKCLLDNQSSVNFFAMHSLTPQNTYNLFENTYSNQLPQPKSLPVQIGAQSFRMAKYLAHKCCSAKDTDPNWLTLDHMAKALNDKEEYKAPHAIVCVPSDDIKTVYRVSDPFTDINSVDFRTVLNGKGKGAKVFDIYAENMEDNSKIGEIYAVSDFIASSFADQELFFQHPLQHD